MPRGTAEILTNNGATSAGVVLDVATVDDVPLALQFGHQMDAFALSDDPRDGVDAAWTALTADGATALVLWRLERDLTIQEIAAALEAEEGGN